MEQKVGRGQAHCQWWGCPPGPWSPAPRLGLLLPYMSGRKPRDLIFLLQTKENDELTRICDDLISKMEKI